MTEPNPVLLQKAVDDRERHPWRYYKLDYETMKRLCNELSTRAKTAEAQVATLTAALRRILEYVQHKSTCPQFMAVKLDFGAGWVNSSQSKPCTCGFDAVLRAASEGAP